MTTAEHTTSEHALREGSSGSRGTKRDRARRRMAAGATACAVSGLAVAGLGVGLAGPASAATAHRVVTSIVETPGTTSFTVKSGIATITVDVTSTTTYVARGVSAPTIANVTAGERVKVRGTAAGTNTVDAARVRVLPALPVTSGTVASTSSLSAGSFTLTRGAATITVTVSSATTYLDHGVSAPTVANVTAGERVEVFGSVSGTNAVDATKIQVLPARPVVTGTVASTVSPSSESFTLTRGAATITVTVSSATTYLDHGMSLATVANVTMGEHVAVFGTVSGTNAVDASQVRAVPSWPRRERRSMRGKAMIGR